MSEERSGDTLVAAYILLNERAQERQVEAEIESELERTGEWFRAPNGNYYLLSPVEPDYEPAESANNNAGIAECEHPPEEGADLPLIGWGPLKVVGS